MKSAFFVARSMNKTLDLLEEMLFPRRCFNCGAFDFYLCPDCARSIKPNLEFQCPNCHRDSPYGAYCPDCRQGHDLDGLWIAADYGNPLVSKMIKAFKYKGVKEAGFFLGYTLAEYLRQLRASLQSGLDWEWEAWLDLRLPLPPILQGNDWQIVAVPLHQRRLRWRGFNQSRILAGAVADFCRLDPADSSLLRSRYTRPQAGQKRKQRMESLKDAFICGPIEKNGKYLLIDDVTSTAATLNECAKTLKAGGAACVWGLVLAQN